MDGITVFRNVIDCLIDFSQKLISLCNENAGFISAILAVTTMFISIKIGRLPYQKKISFYHYLGSDETKEIIATVYVSNIGNCPLYIDKLIAKEGFFKTIGLCEEISNTELIEKRLLESKKTRVFKIRLEGYKWTSSEKWRTLRFVLITGRKKFSYRTNWTMG